MRKKAIPLLLILILFCLALLVACNNIFDDKNTTITASPNDIPDCTATQQKISYRDCTLDCVNARYNDIYEMNFSDDCTAVMQIIKPDCVVN